MKFNYKIPLNELIIKPPQLRFCLAKYKFYAGWVVQRVFEVRQKSADKEVKKFRDQGRRKEARDLAVK